MEEVNSIKEYSKTEAALADLNTRYSNTIFDVTTTQGMTSAKVARQEIKGYRVDLEKERQRIKAPALALCNLIDAEAKRITAELVKLESPIDMMIKAEEARKEQEKKEKAEKERQRVERIQSRIKPFREVVAIATGHSSASIREIIEKTENSIVDAEKYEEFVEEAHTAKQAALLGLNDLLVKTIEQEAEQARIAADRAELEKLRAAQAAEEQRLHDERSKIELEKAAEQKRIDDARQAEEQRMKAEREAQERVLAAERKAHEDKIKAEMEATEQKLRAEKAEEKRKADFAAARCDSAELALSKILKIVENDFLDEEEVRTKIKLICEATLTK